MSADVAGVNQNAGILQKVVFFLLYCVLCERAAVAGINQNAMEYYMYYLKSRIFPFRIT